MAKDVIKVSTQEMQGTISQYSAQKARLMEAFAICVKATALIAQSWAGPSFAVTSAKMATTWANLFQAEKKMDDAIDELKRVIQIMDSTEKSNKTMFAGLDTGSSPFQ